MAQEEILLEVTATIDIDTREAVSHLRMNGPLHLIALSLAAEMSGSPELYAVCGAAIKMFDMGKGPNIETTDTLKI